MLLKGRTAVITGAASLRGIGRRTAQIFAENGARVALLDLNEVAAKDAANSLGEGHIGMACDVTDAESCKAAAKRVLEEFGYVDSLINNAGITQPIKIMDIQAADYEAVTDVSLRGTLYMSQALIPHFRERRRGSIVCMSSVSAQRGGGVFGGPHYAAAKAGVLGLAKAMARELGPDGIRVNSITPGFIQTDITLGKLSDATRADILKSIPLSRLGDTDDVANTCLYLASDLSTYVTGITLDVNGGMLIHL